MARRFFRDTGRGDRPDNVGLFRPAGPRGRPGAGDDGDGDHPSAAPREAVDEPAPPALRPERIGLFPQVGPRGRPDDDRPPIPRRQTADEPAPPQERPRNIGLFRPAGPGGRPGAGDDGDRPRAAPRQTGAEPPPAATGGSESPPQRKPRWPQGARSLPAEAAAVPSEDAPRTHTVSWEGQENSWLHGRVEDLERQLRQRMVALGLSAFVAVVALAGLTVMLLRDPEPPTAALATGPTADAPSDPWFAALPSASSEGGEEPATAGWAADRDAETVRAALSSALERIEELETAGNEREATIEALRAELESTRAEAQTLQEHLDVSRRGIERLNALLARAAGADSSAAPPAPAETGADGAQAAAASYLVTSAANVRAEPTTTAEVLAVIGEGTVVRRIAGEGDWLRVEYPDNAAGLATGWVYGELLRPVGGGAGG